MKKSVVYASTTGNTEKMANAVAEGAKASGAEVTLVTADSADADAVLASDVIYLGSPAMGDEVLEDSVEEFFGKIEGSLSGKVFLGGILSCPQRQPAPRPVSGQCGVLRGGLKTLTSDFRL